MDSKKNFDLAKAIVVNHVNAKGDVEIIDMDQVEYVWASRKEDELKILLRTTVQDDAYYQVRFVDGVGEAYLTAYKALDSKTIRL